MSDMQELGGEWPICRCGTRMHPSGFDERRSGKVERYACPHRRWWNFWHHPHAWEVPRGTTV